MSRSEYSKSIPGMSISDAQSTPSVVPVAPLSPWARPLCPCSLFSPAPSAASSNVPPVHPASASDPASATAKAPQPQARRRATQAPIISFVFNINSPFVVCLSIRFTPLRGISSLVLPGIGARRPLRAPWRTRPSRNSFHVSSSDAGTVPTHVRHLRCFFCRVRKGIKRAAGGEHRCRKAPRGAPREPKAFRAPEASSPERSSSSRSGTAARRSSPFQAPARADAAGRSAGRGCPCWWSSPRSAPIPRRSG